MNKDYGYFNHLVNIGESICLRLKNIYFPNKSWFECNRRVAYGFTLLRNKMKKIHPDKTLDQIVKIIYRYSDEEIKSFVADNKAQG